MKNDEFAKISLPITTFLPAFFWAAMATVVPVCVIVIIKGGSASDLFNAAGAVVMGAGPVLLAISLIAALTYHVRVYPGGVSSYNPYGSWQRDFAEWDDMNEATRVSVLGVPYVRIDGQDETVLWIPARVFDSAQLVSAVQQVAPQSQLISWMRFKA